MRAEQPTSRPAIDKAERLRVSRGANEDRRFMGRLNRPPAFAIYPAIEKVPWAGRGPAGMVSTVTPSTQRRTALWLLLFGLSGCKGGCASPRGELMPDPKPVQMPGLSAFDANLTARLRGS